MTTTTDWRRIAVALMLERDELCATVSKHNYDRAARRGIDARTDGGGNVSLWVNEDEPVAYPVVSGTDLGKGI